MRTIAILAAVGWNVPSDAPAQAKIGTAAAQFLGIPVGARALSMGGAYVGTMSDVSTVYFNPGAFVQARRTEVVFSNTNWLVGTQFRWLGAMVNFDGTNAVAISVTQLDYGEDDITTELEPDGTGGRWSAQDLSAGISYARNLTDRFSIGGTVKYVSQRIWNESASTVAFDAGLLFVTGFHHMRLGMSIANFGGDLTMDGRDLLKRIDIDPANSGSNKTLMANLKTEAWPMPVFFRVGLGLDVVKTDSYSLTVAADALRPSDNVMVINSGAEVSLLNVVYLRAGYCALMQKESEEGMTLGGGLRYDAPSFISLSVDYSFQKFGRFGDVNTLTVGLGL